MPGRIAQSSDGRRQLSAAADQEHVRRRRLRQVAVDGQEQRVVGAGAAGLESGVDVVGAGRGLEGRQRVRRVAPDAARDEVQAALEVVGGVGGDRPRLDRRSSRRDLVGRQQARVEDAARDRDPDRGVAVGPSRPSAASSSSAIPACEALVDVGGQRDRQAVRGALQPGDVLVELGRPAAARAERLEDPVAELEAAVERGQVAAVGGLDPAVDPDVPGRGPSASPGHATSRRRSPTSGPRAFATVSSHSAAGSLRQVIPPPTWSVSRRPSATNVRMRMLVCIAPSGPIQPSAPGVRPAPDRLELLEELHRPDLRRAGDRAARERRREQVERVAAVGRAGRSRSRRGAGPRRSARGGTAAGPGRCPACRPGRGRCEDVDDHHVLGPVLGAGQQLAGERAVLVAGRGRAAGCP